MPPAPFTYLNLSSVEGGARGNLAACVQAEFFACRLRKHGCLPNLQSFLPVH